MDNRLGAPGTALVPTGPSRVSRALARNRLGVSSVVFFIVSAAAPLTVIGSGAVLTFANTKTIGIPVAYAAIAIVLGLFAVGYVAMSRHITNAGAFYTYVAQGLGRVPGVGASFVAVVAYNAMQIGLYGGFGAILATHLKTWFGWNVQWWVLALLAWVVIAVLGVLRIDFNSKVLAVLLTAECLIMLVFNAVELTHPAGGEIGFAALSPSNLVAAGVGALLVTAVTGFVGFEGGAVYAEETRDPKRTVAQATYIAVAFVGVLYAVSSWALTVYTGPDKIVAVATEQQADLIFNINANFLGAWIVDIGRILIVTSLFAALVSFHNTVARYLFALGREQVLPGRLGATHRKTGSPYVGSLVQTGLALVVIVLFVLFGLDPLIDLMYIGTTFGGLGVVILMAITSISVIGYFARRKVAEENLWRRLVSPAIAAVLLLVVLGLTLNQYSALLGLPSSHPAVWILPSVFAVAGLAGICWGVHLKSQRPDVYAAIGLGANSVIGRASRDLPEVSSGSIAGLVPESSDENVADRDRYDVFRVGGDHPVAPVSKVLSDAFLIGEIAEWLVPDLAERRRIYPQYWAMAVEHALGAGDVFAGGELSGVSVWYPAVFGPPHAEPSDVERRLRAICGPYASRFLALRQVMSEAHPVMPHHYLAFVGVRPEQQGMGIGTTLIQHRLRELDETGTPTYLEATNRRNLALYVHLGFQPTGNPITLPDDGPRLYPMWRPASVHRGL
ncbi:amino acid transporter/GNAT superfamily N-acetyltransferase [Kibdelosporangium banguiense]|uniref:Amino acid transporter/GNAT superfamily N-acetyltransferase n=1 Tax=Kibdelosporangium banguiense TaxID=1365924 RepID=A0ABS4T667_9PSEU|nr:amino acid permease [Kibdelosporangium banguiense]MBP2319954.1 amino acid transporter/GNAT superfamily N-acetyltransferase [Kibdelosporangium banguiense]